MLDFIRRHQKWMLVIVILFIVPSFVFLGVFDYQSMLSNDPPLAKVKEQKVTRDQFNMEWRDRLNQLRVQSGNQFDISQVDIPENRRAFLNQMINSRVLHEEVLSENYSATDQMVTLAIASDPQFHDEGRFSVEKYSQFLQRVGIDAAMYESSVRYSLALEQVAEPAKRALTLPKQIEDAVLSALLEERTVRLRLFEASSYFAENEPSEEEAKAWYDANKESLEVPSHVKAEYVILNEEAAVRAVPIPTDTELQQYYESNKSRYTKIERRSINHIQLNLTANASAEELAEVEQKASDIKQQAAANPAQFAELASQYSDDIGSKQLGGSLGLISKGDIPEFDEVAFTPTELGVYGPVQIGNALHIVQVDHIDAGEVKAFEEVREELINEVRLQVASDRFADLSSELVRLANDAGQRLEDISSVLDLPIQTVEGVTQSGVLDSSQSANGAAIFTAHPQLREALFTKEAIEEGSTSGVIELSPTELVVVKVAEHTPAYIPEFSEVEADAVAAVRTEKSLAQAKTTAEEVEAGLVSGEITGLTDFEEAITVSRLMGNLPQSLLDAIMAAPVDTLPSYTSFWMPQGYVVARIESVSEPEDGVKQGLKTQIEELLLTGPKVEIERELLNTLRANTDVTIYDESERVINDTGM